MAATPMNHVDDIKMSNDVVYHDDNSGSSSSDDDSGIVMTKEMRQLTKMQTQVSKNLNKIQSIRVKMNNNDVHQEEKTQFEALLVKINIALAKAEKQQQTNNMKNELKQLRNENKQAKKLFQANKKSWKATLNAEKFKKKAKKQKVKAEKAKVKLEKQKVKEQKKLEREKKKQKRLEFVQTLEKARIEELPIKQQKLLELWIDGWNISGCFGGRSRSKGKLIGLLQEFYKYYVMSSSDNGFADLNNIELFYDGNGKDKLDNNINITHSGKSIIVDDLWIDLLTKKQESGIDTSHIICVTSDRELTVRLYNIGITVMKSGKFFKTYLKPLLPPKETQNGNDSDKKNNHKHKNGKNYQNNEKSNQNDSDIKMDA